MPYREYCVHRRFGIYTVPYMTEVYEHYEEPLRAELQRHVETEFVADRVLHAIENDILCIFTHDAERILRRHLLPAQLRDVSFIDNPPNHDGTVGLRDVANRHLGAFGFSAPYGHESVGKGRGNLSFNMDIVGGVVGSLCAALRMVVRSEPTGHWINLLFDHETSAIRMQSPYTHDCLRVEARQSGPLFVRIPPWLNRDDVKVECNETLPTWTNNYLFFRRRK